MKHIILPSGKEVFIGHAQDGFTLATWKPSQPSIIDPQRLDPSEFRLECPGNKFDISHGKDADAMRDAMLKK